MVGDRELLVQLIANLIENALRHAGPSAKVEIAVSALPGGGARLVVADDGPGVPKSEGDRIFDRFYRLERSRSTEGSGLGLALVAAVARLHGAALSLADAEPGLRVSIAFPAR
jgi:signal transduction histidine kinase